MPGHPFIKYTVQHLVLVRASLCRVVGLKIVFSIQHVFTSRRHLFNNQHASRRLLTWTILHVSNHNTLQLWYAPSIGWFVPLSYNFHILVLVFVPLFSKEISHMIRKESLFNGNVLPNRCCCFEFVLCGNLVYYWCRSLLLLLLIWQWSKVNTVSCYRAGRCFTFMRPRCWCCFNDFS